MQELEKILEEIGELRGQAGSECTSEDHYIKKAWEHCLDRVEYIIRKHMNDGWEMMLSKGFDECMRVLKPDGVLIFKWSEVQIKLSEVLSLFDKKPLFGNMRPKQSGTHWLCFMK